MGQVLSAGAGQAPARQASLGAGVGKQVPATAVSKVCGSGMKSICQGVDAILAHSAKLLVAGGMESMTASPYLLKSARSGARLGHTKTYDHMFLDGLEDAYEPATLMGVFAEDCVQKYQLTRQQQDDYALSSLSRAIEAQKSGAFKSEIAEFTVSTRGKNTVTHRPKACPHALQSRVGQRMRKSQAGSQLRPSQPHKNSCAKSDGRSVRWIFGK